jgi:hypothetical protein
MRASERANHSNQNRAAVRSVSTIRMMSWAEPGRHRHVMIWRVRMADHPSWGDVVAHRHKDPETGQASLDHPCRRIGPPPSLSNRLPGEEVVRIVREQSRRQNRRALMQNAGSEWESCSSCEMRCSSG